MPIYEYQCQECGKRTEAIQRYADAPLTVCPHCNGPLKKLISSPAFQFKGSGWYVTDYARAGSGGGKEDKEGKASSGSDGGEAGGGAKETAKESAPAKEAPATASTKPAAAKGGD
jgi:putative FmdB family regulatory protein